MSITEILEKAKKLTPQEQRQLLEALQELDDTPSPEESTEPQQKRQDKLKPYWDGEL